MECECVLKDGKIISLCSAHAEVARHYADEGVKKEPRGNPFVKCIICAKLLQIDGANAPVTKTKDGRDCMNMTMDGVDCVAHGNYGSTVFDPMDREPNLGFVICDECFRSVRDRMIPIRKEEENEM